MRFPLTADLRFHCVACRLLLDALQAEGRGFESRHLHKAQVNHTGLSDWRRSHADHARLPDSTALHDTLTDGVRTNTRET